jgi:hypothetical protein
VVVLRAGGYQVLLRQRHLRHGRPGESTRVREYSGQTVQGSESTGVRQYRGQRVQGKIVQGSESTSGITSS